jgi:hypothetical protein
MFAPALFGAISCSRVSIFVVLPSAKNIVIATCSLTLAVGVWANSKELMFAQTDWIVTIDYTYIPARKSKDKLNAPCAINLI